MIYKSMSLIKRDYIILAPLVIWSLLSHLTGLIFPDIFSNPFEINMVSEGL